MARSWRCCRTRNASCSVAAGDVSSVIQKDVVNHMGVARSAYESGQMAGWGTRSSPTTEVLYVPLQAADTTAGVLALRPRDPERFLLREQVTLLESLAKASRPRVGSGALVPG